MPHTSSKWVGSLSTLWGRHWPFIASPKGLNLNIIIYKIGTDKSRIDFSQPEGSFQRKPSLPCSPSTSYFFSIVVVCLYHNQHWFCPSMYTFTLPLCRGRLFRQVPLNVGWPMTVLNNWITWKCSMSVLNLAFERTGSIYFLLLKRALWKLSRHTVRNPT